MPSVAPLSPQERASLEQLERVRRQREVFEALARRIVSQESSRHVPAEGQIVEIGAGDGQLLSRLPDSVRARCLHTEPQAAAVRAFATKHPAASIAQARAESLPLADAEVAAVLGSCVLDVVPDVGAVARELARVLRPGGCLIHFLDMSTVLTPIVETLSKAGLVAVPNVFSEPTAGEWPEDLFLLPRRQLELIIDVLRGHEHELARPLAQYSAKFAGTTVAAAVAELVQLQESSALREALKVALRFAHEQAQPSVRQQLLSFQGRPVSSARHFEQRLGGSFSEANGFRVQYSSVVRMWEIVPRGDSALCYMSCCVGEQRGTPYLPATLLCADAARPEPLQMLRELGMFVFVASRI